MKFGRKKDDGLQRDPDGIAIAVSVAGTTADEQLHALLAGAPSVEIAPAGRLRGVEEHMTAAQREAQDDMQHMGMRYNAEERYVTLPPPPPGQNQNLFTRTENALIRDLGMREGFRVLDALDRDGGRPQLAELLARKAMLRPDEIAHLRWLATATNAADDVLEGTTPITPEQARRILGLLDEGVPQATDTRVIRFGGER